MNNVFVGDLSLDVTETTLKDAFKNYPSLVDARYFFLVQFDCPPSPMFCSIMYDKDTGKSRGYAFLVFRQKEDADQVRIVSSCSPSLFFVFMVLIRRSVR